MISIGYVKGRTHGPEYSWHKYWSRKPANVISSYLSALVPESGLVVDPFCGSGVVVREASKLNFRAIAFDVNPVAVFISRFMSTDLDQSEFSRKARELLDLVEAELGYLYIRDGKSIRFLVHQVATTCEFCGIEVVFNKEIHSKNGKRCEACAGKLSFGLLKMSRTVISEICYVDGSVDTDPAATKEQDSVSQHSETAKHDFSVQCVDNRRTLTSSNFETGHFFTQRNFWILSRVAELAHSEEDSEIRAALLLMVTGSSAQASRLIASRGKLASGGQAWTIPGFWVPPVHLESNPFIHLRTRLKKMESALQVIQLDKEIKPVGDIRLVSAQQGLQDLSATGQHADLVFLDPPYGDSVAFVEFSSIWNAFLKVPCDYSKDISVSDRTQLPMTMETYAESLREIAKLCHQVLTKEGKLLLTFNNHDLAAWKAIVLSLQSAGFKTIHVNYQDPAVVSAKSQMSPGGSYVGDFYVVFAKSDTRPIRLGTVRDELSMLLTNAAAARGGSIRRGLAFRFALQRWLELDIDASEVELLEEILTDLFDSDAKILKLKTPATMANSIEQVVRKLASGLDLSEMSDIQIFDTRLKQSLANFGQPTMGEALAMASQVKQTSQL